MPVVQTGPQKKWSTWQVVIGWLRKLLNAGSAAGVWPDKKQGPKF